MGVGSSFIRVLNAAKALMLCRSLLISVSVDASVTSQRCEVSDSDSEVGLFLFILDCSITDVTFLWTD